MIDSMDKVEQGFAIWSTNLRHYRSKTIDKRFTKGDREFAIDYCTEKLKEAETIKMKQDE